MRTSERHISHLHRHQSRSHVHLNPYLAMLELWVLTRLYKKTLRQIKRKPIISIGTLFALGAISSYIFFNRAKK